MPPATAFFFAIPLFPFAPVGHAKRKRGRFRIRGPVEALVFALYDRRTESEPPKGIRFLSDPYSEIYQISTESFIQVLAHPVQGFLPLLLRIIPKVMG